MFYRDSKSKDSEEEEDELDEKKGSPSTPESDEGEESSISQPKSQVGLEEELHKRKNNDSHDPFKRQYEHHSFDHFGRVKQKVGSSKYVIN